MGPVFSPDSGQAFYHAALESKNKAEFLKIWQNFWTREGYNWSSKPIQIKNAQWTAFLSLLEKSTSQSNAAELMSHKEMKKVLSDSYWNLAPWDGRLHIKYARGFIICINVSIERNYSQLPNYGYPGPWAEAPCFSEGEKTLSFDQNTQQFRAVGVDRNPIIVSVMKKNELVTLNLEMTMPTGSSYYNWNDHNRTYHYDSPVRVILKLVKKN